MTSIPLTAYGYFKNGKHKGIGMPTVANAKAEMLGGSPANRSKREGWDTKSVL